MDSILFFTYISYLYSYYTVTIYYTFIKGSFNMGNIKKDNLFSLDFEFYKYLFNTQFDLNNLMCSKSWLHCRTDDNRHIDYKLCIVTEVAELIESLDILHWRPLKVDEENIVIELIDIIHFTISLVMVSKYNELTINPDNRDDLVNSLVTAYLEDIQDYFKEHGNLTYLDNALEYTRNLAVSTANYQINQFISLLYNGYNSVALFTIIAMLSNFSSKYNLLGDYLVRANDSKRKDYLTNNDIMALFTAKAVLNKFRMDNGYKQDKYSKLWILEIDGSATVKEDNYVVTNNLFKHYIANPNIIFGKIYSDFYDILKDLYNRFSR